MTDLTVFSCNVSEVSDGLLASTRPVFGGSICSTFSIALLVFPLQQPSLLPRSFLVDSYHPGCVAEQVRTPDVGERSRSRPSFSSQVMGVQNDKYAYCVPRKRRAVERTNEGPSPLSFSHFASVSKFTDGMRRKKVISGQQIRYRSKNSVVVCVRRHSSRD